jgi:hypothetical protein
MIFGTRVAMTSFLLHIESLDAPPRLSWLKVHSNRDRISGIQYPFNIISRCS